MAKSSWGRKHVCVECQAPFYDMRRQPVTCPKCGVAHRPVALLRSDGRPPRRNRLPPTLGPAPAVEARKELANAPDADVSEADDVADDLNDAEVEPVGGDPGH